LIAILLLFCGVIEQTSILIGSFHLEHAEKNKVSDANIWIKIVLLELDDRAHKLFNLLIAELIHFFQLEEL